MKTSKEIVNLFMDKIGKFEIGDAYISTIAEMIGIDDPNNSVNVIIVTSNKRAYGAMEIFNPEVIKELKNKVGERFYILPSSIHEVLVLPKTDSTDAENLLNIVMDVNRTQVAPEDRLGDFVLEYDGNRDALTIANAKIN